MADEPIRRASLIDRRISKIASARSVALGLAVTFILLAFVSAVIIRLVDKHDFPTLGLAVWWALQTVTTVGYGDAVPTTSIGRVVGGVELVLSVSFVSFLTAGVTSAVIRSQDQSRREEQRAQEEADSQSILGSLAATRDAIRALDSRLDAIESKLPG
jgi:voltage-gated potassium channel